MDFGEDRAGGKGRVPEPGAAPAARNHAPRVPASGFRSDAPSPPGRGLVQAGSRWEPSAPLGGDDI